MAVYLVDREKRSNQILRKYAEKQSDFKSKFQQDTGKGMLGSESSVGRNRITQQESSS